LLLVDVHRDPGVLAYVANDFGLSHVFLELGEEDVELRVVAAANWPVVHVYA
jgi:hypothetical protein